MSALEALIDAYERPPVPESGVVGYVGADVPRELIAAAGLHPLRLKGSVPVTRRADEILGPGVAAPTRSVLAGLLEGRPRLDFLVLSHDSDSTVRLFTALRVLSAEEPLPELWFLDLLHLPTETTAAYNRARLDEFLEVLERWSGRPVSEDSLETASREAAETKGLLARVAELRQATRLRGSEALAIAGAADCLPAVEADRLLEALLDDPPAPLPAPSGRVFVTGSAPTVALYRALEAHGLHVVGEGPIRGSAEAARAAGADAVLAWIRTGDDALAWSVPAVRRATELPLVVLERRDDEALTDDELALLA